MSSLKITALLIASFALAFTLIASPGCSSSGSSKPELNDEQLIRDTIDAWLKLVEDGEQPGPVDLYYPDAWNSSPAKTEWTRFAGKHPAATDIVISVTGTTASATFMVTTDDQEEFQVTWALRKASGDWLISNETWS